MTAEVTDTAGGDGQQGEWVGRAEAVIRLGISQRTLDRKLAQGLLCKQFRADGSVEVLVPLQETVAAKMADTEQAERSLVILHRFNEALASQVAPLVAQNTLLMERIAVQAEEIGRLKTLEHENAKLTAKLTELEQGREIQAKPWWRFW